MHEKDKLLAQAKKDYPKGTIVIDEKGRELILSGEYKWHDDWGGYKGIKNAIEGKVSNDKIGEVSGIVIWGDATGWIKKKSKESKFEVGNWYKHKTDNKYGKCKSCDNYFRFNEIIRVDNTKKYSKDTFTWIPNCVNMKKISLEEIQQYLPDGHPDLISKKFVLPENWHVVVTEENQDILSKWRFGKINGNLPIGYICGKDSWNGDKNSKGHNPRTQIKGNNYDFGIEITFDQFKKYILDSDYDIDKENEFKAGDWIYCIDDGGNDTGHKEWKLNYKNGDIILIDHISDTSIKAHYKVGVSKKGHVLYIEQYKHHFRHATQEEINKVNKPKEMNNEELLIEAKRMYPVGTKFKNAGTYDYGIITSTGKFVDHQGDITDGNNHFLRYKGKWAEIISKPVEKWNKDTYVVFTGVTLRDYLKINTPYKISSKGTSSIKLEIKPNNIIDYTHDKYGLEWFPTLKEAEEFTKTLVKPVDAIPKYVELLSGFDNNHTGEVFDTSKSIPNYSYWLNSWTWEKLITGKHSKHFKSSTKEAYEAQNKPKELKAYTGKFKVGDTVRVTRKVKYKESDWDNSWISDEMDITVGNEYTIKADHGRSGYILECNIYNYPEFVLELVEPKVEEDYGVSVPDPIVKYIDPWNLSKPIKPTKSTKKIPELQKVELLKSKVNKLY